MFDVTKNSSQVVRTQLSEYQGKQRLDIRTYYERNGEMAPTQKGVAIPGEQIVEWYNALTVELQDASVIPSNNDDICSEHFAL